MKILIVDDELLVRIGIKSCLEWHEYGMEIVGEASDGIEAFELINKLQPDVLLLDIKMPKMDGIELMHRLKEEKNKCKVLILSGFDDLYHVKEAMKLGAVDYLHKPCMNSKEILDALLSIKQQLDKELSNTSDSVLSSAGSEKGRRMVKEVFLKSLVDGSVEIDSGIEQRLREHGIRFKTGNINCLVFSVKNLSEIQKRYKESNSSILQSTISNIMNEVLSREDGVDFFTYDRNTYVAVTSHEGVVSGKKIHEQVNSVIYLITDAIKQFLNVDIVIGVSCTHTTIKKIQAAFQEGLKAVRHRFYICDAHVINSVDVKRNNDREALVYVDGLIEKMKDSLSRHDFLEFKDRFAELSGFLKREACLSGEEVKKLSNGFLFIIKEGKASLSEMESINDSETINQLNDVWEDILRQKLSKYCCIAQYQNCCYLVKKLIDYIDKNYAQDITLNLLAENFNVSPNYISRVFREDTGENLFNYLSIVRVEKAKNMLKNQELKIYEVGYRVGFKSTVHFNIVFNKLTGESPKQYRARL